MRVIDPLPSQVTLATPTPSQGTCFGSITCAVGNLAVGRDRDDHDHGHAVRS